MSTISTNSAGLTAGTVPTRNVSLLMELVSRIQDRTTGLPGLGVMHSPPGWVKTRAICVVAVTHNAYYAQVKSVWTRKYLLEAIMRQMNLTPEKKKTSMPHLLDQVGKQLAQSGRPLILDDAHIILEKGHIEIVRDIFESSQGTVILVGEETLPGELEKIERVHSRVLDWVAAEPTNLDDARLFAGLHCPGLTVSDELLEKVIGAARGSARYTCNSLAKIAEFARLHNKDELDTQNYTGPLFTGYAPRRAV